MTMTSGLSVQQHARKSVTVFLLLLIIGTTPLLSLVIGSGRRVEDPAVLPYMIAVMWVPALASFITRLIMREGFTDVSFRVGGREGVRAIGAALAFPAAIGFVAYGSAWSTGVAHFIIPAGGWYAGLEPGILRFLLVVLTATIVGGIVGTITAAGEEFGWRGYLLPRLVQAGVRWPLTASGILWGLWHVPAIFSGQYGSGGHPVLAASLFMIFAVGMSVFWGTLRMRTGSVWSAVIGHAAWNAVIEGPFTSFTDNAKGSMWVGESGVLVAVVVSVAGYLIWRKLRGPGLVIPHADPYGPSAHGTIS